MTLRRSSATARMTDVEVERSSGNATLDLIATRAVRLARQLPPLPAEYPTRR